MLKKVKFKSYRENTNDMIAVDMENGENIIVDPFVGCAFRWENASDLIGVIYDIEGHYHSDGAFLVAEGEMKLFKETNSWHP